MRFHRVRCIECDLNTIQILRDVSSMSALNMAMNGNAYKMIEIKKVSGPVVPLTSLNPLNPLTTLTDRYEPLPNPQNQVCNMVVNNLYESAYSCQEISNIWSIVYFEIKPPFPYWC